MCGIIGVVMAPGQPPPAPELGWRMNAVIQHRGPDDGGLHHDDQAVLGMRRLAVIDVAGGHQPMYAADQQVCLVFNGEIYNFRELRSELERDGHVFASSGDTEVILHGYLRHGADIFAKLDGMFAIAIWDRRDRSLLLARDRWGEKPLYYSDNGQRLLFGSEMKSLLQAPDCPRTLNEPALQAYLSYGYVPAPLAIFSGVHKLPPAHYLRYTGGQISIHRYWAASFAPQSRLSETEAAQTLETLLRRAVSSRLIADVPFGAFLSGGLDSSTIVALMAQHSSQPVKTFSIGFAEAQYSELEDARRVALHLGTEHHELVVEPDAVALLHKLIWHFDEPFADASAVPTYLVSQLARRHVTMVLTGDAGDELFGGYDRYLRLLKLERLGLLQTPAAALLRIVGGLTPDPYGKRMQRVAERLRLPFQQRYLSGVALMRPDTVARLRATTPATTADHYRLPMLELPGADLNAGDSVLDRAVAIDLQSYLPDDILVKVDRMAMANSLEGRSPFLHPELAQFALHLPPSLRIRDGRGKYLLRQVAQKWLPPRAISKPKQGFAIPLPVWFRGPLRTLASDTFSSRRFSERGLIAPAAANALLNEHQSGAVDHSEALWQILCLELWAQRFIDTDPGAH